MEHWVVVLLATCFVLLVSILLTAPWPVDHVLLESVPGGARVTVPSGYTWVTPAWIPVPERGIRVTLEHPDRASVDTTLVPGTGVVRVFLPYLFRLLITSDPPGAKVLFDGVYAGRTPCEATTGVPGIHILGFDCGDSIFYEDTLCLLINRPDTVFRRLPVALDHDMVLLPPSDSAGRFAVSRFEVTNGDFCGYLRYLEPAPVIDSTARWGRTPLVESLFPVDYTVPFHVDSSGRWAVNAGMEDHPVAGVSPAAAGGYCEWLTENRGGDTLVFRLPTPAEWEAAYLAGGRGPWPWGGAVPSGGMLNLSDVNEIFLARHPDIDDGFPETAPVGTYPPNGWGLYDMAGNLWEYCVPEDRADVIRARGGSWLSSMDDCRFDAVLYPDTTLGYPFIGFRVFGILARD